MGYSKRTLDIVELVSKRRDEKRSYDQRIEDIIKSKDWDALELKFADISENTAPQSLRRLRAAVRQRLIQKYSKPREKLIKIINGTTRPMRPGAPSARPTHALGFS